MESEQEISLDTAYMIELENQNQTKYAFYYEDYQHQIKGLKFPKINLYFSGGDMMHQIPGKLHIEFENNSGVVFLKLRLSNDDNICGSMSSREYINKLSNNSGGREGNIYVRCKINNSPYYNIPISEIKNNDGYLKFPANELGLNLNNSECEIIVTDLCLYDNSGLRETVGYQEYTRSLPVVSGSSITNYPTIPNFKYGNLTIGTIFSGSGISWGGFTSGVSATLTAACYATVNGQKTNVGAQRDIWHADASWRYINLN